MSDEKELRETPSFSVNKLAEYMVASATRRRSLIIDQIKPVVYRTGRYRDAAHVLTRFCADPGRTTKQLLNSAAVLRDRAADPACDDFRRECLKDSARAIEAFASVAYDVRVHGLIATAGKARGVDLSMGGVRVTINPDIYFIEPGTERRVGAAKLHIARTEPLKKDALQYVAALLSHWIKLDGSTPRVRACLAIDVFSGEIESAPKTTKTMLRNLNSACLEISERWPALYAQIEQKDDNAAKAKRP